MDNNKKELDRLITKFKTDIKWCFGYLVDAIIDVLALILFGIKLGISKLYSTIITKWNEHYGFEES